MLQNILAHKMDYPERNYFFFNMDQITLNLGKLKTVPTNDISILVYWLLLTYVT